MMDALGALLEGPRASGAFVLRVVFDPPWSIRIQDGSPLCVAVMLQGRACIEPAEGESVWMEPGDVAVIRGAAPYRMTSDPAVPTQVIVHPGQRCMSPEGEDLREQMTLGVRAWGTNAAGSVQMLMGVYEEVGAVGQRLVDVLPPVLVVSGDSWDSTLLPVLAREATREGPAQSVVLDRLLDLALIAVLRVWFDKPETEAPAWYRAYTHPVVGQALRLFHEDPAAYWTLDKVAADIGVSRAGLAQTFRDMVGTPPMTYLAEWRMALAADILWGGDVKLDAVARKVGYGSGFAFSAAFKRVFGMSPTAYRQRSTADLP